MVWKDGIVFIRRFAADEIYISHENRVLGQLKFVTGGHAVEKVNNFCRHWECSPVVSVDERFCVKIEEVSCPTLIKALTEIDGPNSARGVVILMWNGCGIVGLHIVAEAGACVKGHVNFPM